MSLPRALAGSLALTTAMAGCSVLSSSGAIGPSEAEVKQAYDQKNLDYLTEKCNKAHKRPQGGLFGLPITETEQKACKYAEDLTKQNALDDLDSAFASYEAGLTCDNAVQSYKSFAETNRGAHTVDPAYHSAGMKLVECGDYKGLITGLLPLDESEANKLMVELGNADPSLQAHLAEAANGDTFSFEGSAVSAAVIIKWLVAQPTINTCESYLAALKSSSLQTATFFVEFHGIAKCKPAAATIASALSSENDVLRYTACEALGRIGDKAHAKKIRVVAETDSAYTTNGLVKTYWVQDMCREALGKIELAN